MKNFVKSFWNNEDGAELAEYAVAVALLVAIGVLIFLILNASGDISPFSKKLHLRARFSSGDGLRRGMRVVDVSRNNDWSSVRVWHEPTDQMGLRVYAAYGFIMPEGEEAPRGGRMLDAGDRGMDQGFASSPRGRTIRTAGFSPTS